MEPTLEEYISKAISKARSSHNTRENSLVITKLQEALMWHNESLRVLQDLARKNAGVNNNVGVPQGEPVREP